MRIRRTLRLPFSCAGLLWLTLLAAGCASAPGSGDSGSSDALPEGLCDPDVGAPPAVHSITPTEGRRNGNSLVTINGQDFQSGATVLIGKAACTAVSVIDRTTLTCMTPARGPGRYPVTVINPDRGCSRLARAYTYVQSVTLTPVAETLAVNNPFTFIASQGAPPYVFSIVSGDGKIVAETGEFKAPETPGTTVVRVADATGSTAESVIYVLPAVSLTAPGHLLARRTFQFTHTGGVPPASFSVVSGGGSVDASGLYTAPESVAEDEPPVRVAVEDARGNRAEVEFKVHPDFQISPNPPLIAVGNRVTGTGGLPPTSFAILSGDGTAEAGNPVFTAGDTAGTVSLRQSDAAGNFKDFLVTVNPALNIFPTEKTLTLGDSVTLFASGGVPPYTFSKLSGAGTIDAATGRYVAPEADATQDLLQVTDSLGNTAQATIRVTIEGFVLSKITAGHAHTCALKDSAAYCWGNNSYGQLGNGRSTRSPVPVPVTGLGSGVLALAAGLNHTCALLNNGSIKCWGDNSRGQLGNGTTNRTPFPTPVLGIGAGAQAIAAGQAHTCAVVNGALLCWGDNHKGQLGNGSTLNSMIPVQVRNLTRGVQSVATGSWHTCALVEGKARCWGYNYTGQIGDGTTIDRLEPTMVKGLDGTIQSLHVGGFHSCALISDSVRCWGYNGSGQLGNDSRWNSLFPVPVKNLPAPASLIALGNHHSCALAGGKAYCWGSNNHAQCTNTIRTQPIRTPRAVTGLPEDILDLAAGIYHSCVLIKDAFQCWGTHDLGSFVKHPVPIRK